MSAVLTTITTWLGTTLYDRAALPKAPSALTKVVVGRLTLLHFVDNPKATQFESTLASNERGD